MSREIAVLVHTGRLEAVNTAVSLISRMRSAGLDPVLVDDGRYPTLADQLPPDLVDIQVIPSSEVAQRVELVVVLGGDGTILRAADLVEGTGVPLLGVNLGHIGFLAEAEAEQIDSIVSRIAQKDLLVEERSTLDITIHVPGKDPIVEWAINDAAIEKETRGRMTEIALGVDGHGVSTFGCDGIVIATATGSTAHAFSAGGPIVWPNVEMILIVPLAAHALFSRPLVVGPTSTVTAEILQRGGSNAVLTCDGQRDHALPTGSRVEIRRGQQPIRLARLTEAPFSDRLVGKFALPVDGWRKDR